MKKNTVFLWSNICKRLTFILCLLPLLLSPSVQGEEAKFILIHLDAIAASDFYEEMDRGNLPNLERFFEKEGAMLKGLTLFPGGTQMIVSRMKSGLSNRVGEPVGWGIYDPHKERMTGKREVFFQYAPSVQRRARECFINIYPLTEFQGWLSLNNLPYLLDTYNVLEFYWFTTDFYGHYLGERLHNASLRRFDYWFGVMTEQLPPYEVNVILYGDHGMSFSGKERIYYEGIIEESVGEKVLGSRYPNLFLKEEVHPREVAQRIGEIEEICLSFYQKSPTEVIGYHTRGTIYIHEDSSGHLSYTVEGWDYFGYYDEGYEGEYLNKDQWLLKTLDSSYPGAVVNIYNLVQNPQSGDVVNVVNPPRVPIDRLATLYPFNQVGGVNHTGVYHTDLLVPVLLRGPDLTHLYNIESIWLHRLYSSIPALSFEDLNPSREDHSLQIGQMIGDKSQHSLSFSYSPAYGWQTHFKYRPEEVLAGIAYDIYSSYLIRLFLKASLSYRDETLYGHLQPLLTFMLGPLSINYSPEMMNRREEISFDVRLSDQWSFFWEGSKEAGVRFYW